MAFTNAQERSAFITKWGGTTYEEAKAKRSTELARRQTLIDRYGVSTYAEAREVHTAKKREKSGAAQYITKQIESIFAPSAGPAPTYEGFTPPPAKENAIDPKMLLIAGGLVAAVLFLKK